MTDGSVATAKRDRLTPKGARSGTVEGVNGIDVYTDLHWEDDDANLQALIDTDEFDPCVVYPGAVVEAGHEHAHEPARVVRTELHHGLEGRVRVLITLERLN
jgi:hypothetical protein